MKLHTTNKIRVYPSDILSQQYLISSTYVCSLESMIKLLSKCGNNYGRCFPVDIQLDDRSITLQDRREKIFFAIGMAKRGNYLDKIIPILLMQGNEKYIKHCTKLLKIDVSKY